MKKDKAEEKEKIETQPERDSEDIVNIPRKELEALKKKAEEKDSLWDKYLRLYAEYENAKKAWQRQKEELLKFANFRILKEFLTFLDEMEAGLNSLREVSKKEDISRGLEMIHSKLKVFLEKEGLKEIDTQSKFDPHLHEALFFEEREDLEEHTIIEVIQKGYLYEGKVLRTAKVKVSVKPKEDRLKEDTLNSQDKDAQDNKKQNT